MRAKLEHSESGKKSGGAVGNPFRGMASDSSALGHDKVNCVYLSPDTRFPLFAPREVRMHKCENQKCGKEFCSYLNWRRHTRSHRKPLQQDKDDLGKERESISQFLAQLPSLEVSKILSVAGYKVQEISGSRVLQFIEQFESSAYNSFSHAYFKARARLRNAIHEGEAVKPDELFLNPDELFGALDDASEKTFLALGTSANIAKHVYEKDQEERDAIASWAFLMEDKMMQAWRAEKNDRAENIRKNLVIELTREEENRKVTREEENKKPKRGKKAKRHKKKKGLAEGTEIQKLEGGSSAADSEGSDQEKADAETWADEPDPEKLQENLKDADASSSKTQVFPTTTDELEQEHSPVFYRPRPHRSSRVTNASKDANGYYRWARKDKGVSDACTTVDRREDECVREVLNEKLGTDNSGSQSGQGSSGVEVEENIIGTATDNSAIEQSRNLPDGQVEELTIGTESDRNRAEQSDYGIEVEDATGSRMDPNIQVEALMIGTVIVPLHARALDSTKPLRVPFRSFDSLEKELFSPPEREEVQEDKVAEGGGDGGAEQEVLTDNADPKEPTSSEGQEFAKAAHSCSAFLSKRWDDAVSDSEAVFTCDALTEASAKEDESRVVDGGESGEVGNFDAGKPKGDEVGREEEGGNFGFPGGEDDERIDGRNGTYKKAGGRKRSKAWEHRLLTKQQAPR